MSGLDAVGVRVSEGSTVIVDGVDLEIPTGGFTALIGPNGAGKSTLLRAIAGVSRPSAGVIRFDEDDLGAMPRRRRAQTVGFVEQDSSTDLSLSVRDVVELGRTPHRSMFGDGSPEDHRAVDDAVARTGISSLIDRDITTLSGGERQRVLLAKALAQQPRLLILDEPTNHLDIGAQLDTLALLTELTTNGVTVLAALHDLTLAAAWSDHIVVIADGRVVAAGPTTSTLTAELIEEVYGVAAVVLEHPHSGRPVVAFSRRGAEDSG